MTKAVLVGAGRRGFDVFGKFALEFPQELQFSAVVEPNQRKREFFAQAHNIPVQFCYSDLDTFLANSTGGVAINATDDLSHFSTTKALLEAGFHVLLEKPIATRREECQILARIAQEKNLTLMICHVLRYAPFFQTIKHNLHKIGEIRALHLVEDVGKEHFAHSYVRGNWNNSTTSGPIALTKTCHDFDIIVWLLNYQECTSLFSFSPALFFSEQNAPTEVPDFCLKGCDIAEHCQFFAPKVYTGPLAKPRRQRAVAISLKKEEILHNLEEGKYGRCVYKCDNNVPDTQITTMQFGDVIATLTMVTDREESTRLIKIQGSEGSISGNVTEGRLQMNVRGETHTFEDLPKNDPHGGGDFVLIRDFVSHFNPSTDPGQRPLNKQGKHTSTPNIAQSLMSHELAFRAEEARVRTAKY